MKLFEFTYTDGFNQTIEEINKHVEELLEEEAEQQGWAEGYSIHLLKSVEISWQGDRIYSFEVHGKYRTSAYQTVMTYGTWLLLLVAGIFPLSGCQTYYKMSELPYSSQAYMMQVKTLCNGSILNYQPLTGEVKCSDQ